MWILTKLENRLVVPGKYLLNWDSKVKQKGNALPTPWLRQKEKKALNRSKLASQDSSDQRTKDTLKPNDISNLESTQFNILRSSSKCSRVKNQDFDKWILKKKILNKRGHKKNMNILYTSWNIKL